jgi:hypothetical protein
MPVLAQFSELATTSDGSGFTSPLNRLSNVTTSWEFTWAAFSQERLPAYVLFAGLAPGMISRYQIDVGVRAPVPRHSILYAKHPPGFVYTFASIRAMQ